MSNEQYPEKVCRVCRSQLDLESCGGKIRYVHNAAWLHDHPNDHHEPDPAPMDEFTSIDGYCDFCSGKDLSVTFSWLEPIKIQGNGSLGSLNAVEFSADWASCEACAVFVRARDLSGLIDRVRVAMGGRGVHLSNNDVQALNYMYRNLFKEPFVEAPMTGDDPFGHKGIAKKLEELRHQQ